MVNTSMEKVATKRNMTLQARKNKSPNYTDNLLLSMSLDTDNYASKVFRRHRLDGIKMNAITSIV